MKIKYFMREINIICFCVFYTIGQYKLHNYLNEARDNFQLALEYIDIYENIKKTKKKDEKIGEDK